MVVKVVQLVVVDRNARMGLGLGPDLVVAHGTVVLRILGRAVDVWVMWKALEEADLAGVVYRRNRPSPHRSPQAVDQRA
jgi:hypothetical protein